MYYIIRKGNKWLHLHPEHGISWGKKAGAFRFYSEAAAWEVGCGACGDSKFYIEKMQQEK